jgi:hypothetical protein
MSGGMTFRKDCEGCGHSFLTPDRKLKFCPRCSEQGRKVVGTGKLHPSKPTATAKTPDGKRPPKTPDHKPVRDDFKKVEIPTEDLKTKPELKTVTEDLGKPKDSQTPAEPGPQTKPEVVLTEEQTQEIITRYQAYVQIMERPARGRRKTIAAEMGIPYRAVVLALRHWNQAQGMDLSREDHFSVEKAYFSFLEKESSFAQLKDRICRETGLNPWPVSRYLDILHDGEDKLKGVSDVSWKERNAILAEYKNYLAGSAPPGPFLHPMIAEKTGVSPKQVYKILLAYRLDKFRERWI